MSSESSVNCVCELCLPKGALGPVELVTDDWEANNNNNKLTELKKKMVRENLFLWINRTLGISPWKSRWMSRLRSISVFGW